MNKHTKFFVAVLFVILAVLVVAIGSFSVDVSQNTDAPENSVADMPLNTSGVRIFQSEDGLYGLEDAGGNTLIEAQWVQMQFLDNRHLAAVLEDEDGRRTGVLDLDGNVVAPFVYQEIQAITTAYFLATYVDSHQCVLYDNTFHVVESAAWDSCEYEDAQITLAKGEDVFCFAVEETELTLIEIELARTYGDSDFETNWHNDHAGLLMTAEWSYGADLLAQLLEMLESGDFSTLISLTDQSHEETILTVASQISPLLRRTDRTAYVTLASSEEESTVSMMWQIDASMRAEDGTSQEQTITVTMKKNEQQVWVITGLQFE